MVIPAEPRVTEPVIPGDEVGGTLPLGLMIVPAPPVTPAGGDEELVREDGLGDDGPPRPHPAASSASGRPIVITRVRRTTPLLPVRDCTPRLERDVLPPGRSMGPC